VVGGLVRVQSCKLLFLLLANPSEKLHFLFSAAKQE
jgi:hypothetical protein